MPRRRTAPTADELYEAIAAYYRAHGYGPSYRELLSLTGIRSLGTIYALMDELYERGLLETDLPFRSPRGFRLATFRIMELNKT